MIRLYDWVRFYNDSPVCIILAMDNGTALLQQAYNPRAKVQNLERFWVSIQSLIPVK